MRNAAIRLGKREIGRGSPAFLVAEIGINHNGDMRLARATIDAAAEAGADSVKFQNYRTEDFVADRALTYEYVSRGETIRESQYEMFKRYELSPNDLADLKAHCDRRGVVFHSTPTNTAGIAELVAIGTAVLKNGSDYLGHLPLVQAMGETGLPTVLSTGMATLSEIDDAVRVFRATGNEQLLLLHCVSRYPTPADDLNLRRISTLESAFGCPVGFSDHSEGSLAAALAVSLGACWIEKHFTLDRNMTGPDHRFSTDPASFRELVANVRTAEDAMGDAAIGPTADEAASRHEFKLSCAALTDLPKGHVITDADIGFQRPGTGHPPKMSALLVGRRLRRPVRAAHVFSAGDFE